MKMNIKKIVLLQIVFLCLGSSVALAFEYGKAVVNVQSYPSAGNSAWGPGHIEISPYSKTYKMSYSGATFHKPIDDKTGYTLRAKVCTEKHGWVDAIGNSETQNYLSFTSTSDPLTFDPAFVIINNGVSGVPDVSNLECNGLPEEENPCEEKKDQLIGDGRIDVEGRFVTTFCYSDNCEGKGDLSNEFIAGVTDENGQWLTFLDNAKYTGNQCSSDTDSSDLPVLPSPVVPPKDQPDPEDPTEEYPYDEYCEDMKNKCNDLMCPKTGQTFTCDPKTGDYDCVCTNSYVPQPEVTPEKPADKEAEKAPADATGSDKAIVGNQGKQIDQGNTIIGQLDVASQNLEIIAKNTGDLVSSLGDGGIGDAVKGGVKDGIGDALDGIEDAIEGLGDEPQWESGSGAIAPLVYEEDLFQAEVSKLAEHYNTIKTEIAEATGLDLSGSSRLPSWDLPTPFGTFEMDMNDYSDVFDIMGNVVLFAAYLSAAIIIFG